MSQLDSWVKEWIAKDRAPEWETIEAKDLHSSSELNHPVLAPRWFDIDAWAQDRAR